LPNVAGFLGQKIGVKMGYGCGLGEQKQHRRECAEPPDPVLSQCFAHSPMGTLE
jgi:hypothetical protein